MYLFPNCIFPKYIVVMYNIPKYKYIFPKFLKKVY